MRHILIQYPKWFLQLFTEAKSFEDNPIIGSYLLNLLGLHVFRILVAYGLTSLRRLILGLWIPEADRRAFRRDGFVFKEHVVPEALFHQIQSEINADWPEVRYFIQGDTTTEFVYLDSEKRQHLPATRQLSEINSINRLLKYVAACGLTPWMDYMRILSSKGDAASDPQKTFHADTFHPTMKAWLFTEDVSPDKGPYEYVPGSHKLTWKRLSWEYRQSLRGKQHKTLYARRGSPRIDRDDLDEMGLGPAISFAVPANSLVIADTFGFHRRGVADPNSSRTSVAYSVRINPFVPVPLPGWRCFDRIAETLVREHYRATTGLRCNGQSGGR